MCGKGFYAAPSEVARGHAKFCSQTCWAEHRKKTPWVKHGKLTVSGIDKVCPICKAPFRTSGLKGHERPYCSRTCALKGRGVEKTCPRCGKEFRIPRSNATRYKFCSLACKNANVTYAGCRRCGKEFRVGFHTAYCSEKCYRPPVFYTCLTCGKTARSIGPGSRNGKPRRFCSLSCCRKYRGETTPETNVRLSLEALKIPFIQEHRLGRYRIDFFLQQHNIALEVDGGYWHKEILARDAKRNRFITESDIEVIRISSVPFESQFAPHMIDTLRGQLFAPLI